MNNPCDDCEMRESCFRDAEQDFCADRHKWDGYQEGQRDLAFESIKHFTEEANRCGCADCAAWVEMAEMWLREKGLLERGRHE